MNLGEVKLSQGIHVMHLFFRLDRAVLRAAGADAPAFARAALEKLCAQFPGPAHPRVASYVNVGGKADLAFMLYHADLAGISAMQRAVELAFPPGALVPVYTYLSVTELPDYVSNDDDLKRMIEHGERKLKPGTPEFDEAFKAAKERNDGYKFYRLNPELEDWEIMCFYPMNKKRSGADNWYSQDFDTRKKLMAGHAKTGRKYAGRISQLITGSTGIDDWEWGVTLMAHQLDAVKEIVYEMRFDEVSARFGEFGQFYINLRMNPAQIWEHLQL